MLVTWPTPESSWGQRYLQSCLKELKEKLKEIETNEMEYNFMKAGGDIKHKARAEFLHLLFTE